MHSKADHYERVKDLMSRSEFERKVSEKVAEWGELIDEDAAAQLVLDELGRKVVRFDSISQLKDGLVNISARVDSVGEQKEFVTRRGPGKVLNVSISDGTGRCRLALWDDDIALVSELGLAPGKRIRVLNGYAKTTRFGIDISRGKWGRVELEE